jgi:hypothetical protein
MSDDPEDISRALGFVQAARLAELEEWKAAYRKGWRERNQRWTRSPPPSPPLSDAFRDDLDYLDGLIAGIRELDTAQSEQRIRRSMRVIERRRLNGLR